MSGFGGYESGYGRTSGYGAGPSGYGAGPSGYGAGSSGPQSGYGPSGYGPSGPSSPNPRSSVSGGGGGFNQRGGFGGGEVSSLTQEVINSLNQFSENINKLKNAIPNVGTHKDGQDLRNFILKLNQETNALAASTTKLLHSVHRTGTGSEGLTAKKLAEDYRRLLASFQQVTTDFKQKEIQFPLSKPRGWGGQRSNLPTGGGGGGQYYDDGRDNQEDENARLLDAERRDRLRQMEHEININDATIERTDKEIAETQKVLLDIAAMMQDMATMVQSQGVMIENIESQVSEAAERTDQGVAELVSAKQHQKSSTSKLACIAGICVVVVAVAVVLVVLGIKFF